MDEDVPKETLIIRLSLALPLMSVVDCCRSDNMVYAFAMLLALAPPDYYLSHAPSKCERNEARDIRGRAREQRRAVRLTPLNQQEY